MAFLLSLQQKGIQSEKEAEKKTQQNKMDSIFTIIKLFSYIFYANVRIVFFFFKKTYFFAYDAISLGINNQKFINNI